MTIELRSFELKVHATGRRLEGYAALFDIETRIGHLVESIAPGAFGVSLSGDVIALVGHDHSRVLARSYDKTLRLSEDSNGLAFDFDVPATSVGNNVLALVERGDLSGTSFGFMFHEGGETWEGNKRTLRTIDLREISLVSAWPASKVREISVGAKVVKMIDFLRSHFTLAAPGVSCAENVFLDLWRGPCPVGGADQFLRLRRMFNELAQPRETLGASNSGADRANSVYWRCRWEGWP